MKKTCFVFMLAALLLVVFSAMAVDPYPQTLRNPANGNEIAANISQEKVDALIWCVCYGGGFTYDPGTGEQALPNIATFDASGNLETTSTVRANWPAGQEAAMETFYMDQVWSGVVRKFAIGKRDAQRDLLIAADELKTIEQHETSL